MKNLHKLLIVLISVVFISSGVLAQSDVSPKLQDQLEVKVKPAKTENVQVLPTGSEQVPTQQDLENAQIEMLQERLVEDYVMEMAPNANKTPYNSDAIFDLQFDFPVGVGGGEAGIETDGNYIYTSKWNGTGDFMRYDIDGTYIETIIVAGSNGCRDIAYDGTYFYGGAASTTIFEMDLATATMISTFTGPAACRAVAYSEEDDAFYCNNWSDNITKFDKSGANLGSFAVGASAASYYGFAFQGSAYCGDGPFLWGHSQTGATQNELIQMDLPSGTETGLTFDVGSVANVGAGIAGGLAISSDLVTGYWTILGTSQNENIWGLELCTSGPLLTDDIGISAITSPNSGVGLTASETVTVTVKNFGTDAQSNFDVWFTLDGGAQVVETISATINGGDTYSHTFGTTVDLSAVGSYTFESCTDLTGDENTANDCKTKVVDNNLATYCDASTTTEDEWIANVLCGTIDNTSGWQGGVADYTAQTTIILPGTSEDITVTNGNAWASDIVHAWVDWNVDYTFEQGGDEEFILTNVGGLGASFVGQISVPASIPNGLYRMRVRMTYSTAPVPCGNSSYGEVEEYSIIVGVADYGIVSGTVTVNTGGAAIAGAMININNGSYTATSAADGTYEILDVLTGDWPIACTFDGYNPASGTVNVTSGGTTTYDFPMTAPTMDIDPLTVAITIDPNSQATETIDISNNGDGLLSWTGQLEMLTDATEDMWDVLLDVPVGVGGGEAGIETDGNYIYTSKWNGAGEFYRYQMDGTYVETITVAGSTGCRDIAYDGTYFYGGAASTTIFEMDLANAAMISTFTGPAACRAVAYSADEDVFYCNNWSDNITKFDKSGANLGNFAVGASAASYYGFAYDNVSAPGTPYLWGYSQTGTTQNELIQMELPSGNETGFTFDVGSVTNVGAGIAGGLAIDNNIVPGLWAFLGTSQNENIWALEIGPAGAVWLSIDPTSGDVDPGNTGVMTLSFDATDIPAGTVKTANIHFASDPDVGTVTVPVSMTVGDLDFGFVNGNVFLEGAAPYNIGDVTEAFVEIGPYTGFPDSNGDYSIQVYPGTYDATVTLYGYDTQTATGIVVVALGTVTQDFSMPCLYGEVSGTVTELAGGAPIDGATVDLVGTDFTTTTAADGTYSLIAEAGTYDVHVSISGFGQQTDVAVVSAQATTTVDFALEVLDGIIVVIDMDPVSNLQIVDVIQGFFPGGLVEYTTSFSGYPLNEEVQTVFILLGIFPGYVLTEADATIITTWVDTYGGNVYMEGSDTWAYDAPTSLHGYFNITGVADGTGDLATITGIDSFWSGFEWGYAGLNNYIDHLDAIAPAINVMENQAVGYYCGVAYDEGTYKTVGASFAVTGVVDGGGSFDMGVATIMGFFGYPVFAYGDLEGHVEDGDGADLEGALVSLGGLGSDETDANGDYLIEDVLIGTWTAMCTKDGYNPAQADVTILDGGTTVQDFVLTAPDFNVDPTTLSVTLDPNAQALELIDIENPGSGTVAWNASITIIGDGGEDMWDVLMDVPVGVGGGEAGIETNGNYIYTSKWNGAGEFYRYQMDGTYVETITVAGSTGCRDIAYDGTYFYGGAASTTIFEMDLDNAAMISTFTGPAACRAVAYSADEDVFYCNNWSDNITKFDKSGANLGNFAVGASAPSYYGFAYDGYSDGNPFLWGYSQTGATQNELIQMELPSGNETGLTFDVGSVTSVGAGIAGGLAIDDHIAAGIWAFLGTSQNENIWALELAPAGPVWLTIDPTSGTLASLESEVMDANFDATGLLPGVYQATINFSTTPDVGSPVVDVTLTVEGLIPAINLMAVFNCTDIELTWETPTGGNPDSWNVYKDGTLLGNATSESYTDPMVDPEVEYCYEVTAVYGGDESFPTPEYCITVPTPDDLEAIDPTAVHVGAGDVQVSWDAPEACLAPDSYDVYRDGSMIGNSTTLGYLDPGLTSGFYEYYVVAVYYFGNSGNSDPAYVLVGVDELNASQFQIFPNPAKDLVNVRSDYHINTMIVMNNVGQVVVEKTVESNSFQINVSQYERGIYYIRLVTDEGSILRKIAVE